MLTKKITFLFITLLSLPAFPVDYRDYTVLKDDSLSKILYHFQIAPLYGPHGKIREVLKINKISGEGNKIIPGQKILIPIPPFTLEKKKAEESNKERRLYFKVNFSPSYFKIDSKDKVTGDSISVLSEVSPEIRINLQFKINQKSSIQLTAGALFFSFQKDETLFLKNKNGNKTFLLAEYLHKFDSLSALVGLSMKEEMFPFSKNAGELSLEKKVIPQLRAGVIYPFIQKNSIEAEGRIGADYLLSQEANVYQISTGTRFWSGINFSHASHELGLFFNLQNQDTSIATKKEQQVGLSYGYTF